MLVWGEGEVDKERRVVEKEDGFTHSTGSMSGARVGAGGVSAGHKGGSNNNFRVHC